MFVRQPSPVGFRLPCSSLPPFPAGLQVEHAAALLRSRGPGRQRRAPSSGGVHAGQDDRVFLHQSRGTVNIVASAHSRCRVRCQLRLVREQLHACNGSSAEGQTRPSLSTSLWSMEGLPPLGALSPVCTRVLLSCSEALGGGIPSCVWEGKVELPLGGQASPKKCLY